MSAPNVGFIGFGEAAMSIAGGLTAEGVSGISAFDIRPRPDQDGVTRAETLEALLAVSDIVFAAVTCTVALEVAEQAAPTSQPATFMSISTRCRRKPKSPSAMW